jgi:hypothetical protein
VAANIDDGPNWADFIKSVQNPMLKELLKGCSAIDFSESGFLIKVPFDPGQRLRDLIDATAANYLLTFQEASDGR